MNRIFCISGIGADERIFKHLDIAGYELVPVKWIPFEVHDDLPAYAKRLSQQITEPEPILMGLSFGGMLAVEIGKMMATKKIILVSSAKASSELPWISGLSITPGLIDLIPESIFTKSGRYGLNLAGAKNADDRKILSVMMKSMPPGFIKQALKLVVTWNNTVYPSGIIQLHGTSDRVIPGGNVRPDHWIKGGTHVMIYNRAEEINRIIDATLLKS